MALFARKLQPFKGTTLAPVRNRGWAFAGACVGVLAASLWFAPAQWLATACGLATDGQVLLDNANGTLWKGSAQLVLRGGAQSQAAVALPGRVEWHLNPAWTGLNVQLEAACCMAQPLASRLRLGWNRLGLQIDDHQSNWPAGLLAGLGTPWNTVMAQGNLAVDVKGLSVEWSQGRSSLAGRFQMDAMEMTSSLSTLKPMGSYRLTLDGGSVNTLKLETLQGSLQLVGSGQWVGGRLRFEGVASAAPERQEALANLLNIIGRRDGARSVIKLG